MSGDWAMLIQVFKFLGWGGGGETGGCLLCRCHPDQARDCGLSAPWRFARLTHHERMVQIYREGKTMSPLFACPGMRSQCFKQDLLHIVDQGTTSDCLGSFMYYLLKQFHVTNKKEKWQNMFLNIQAFYRAHQTESRYDNLKRTMFSGNKGYKLRAK